MAKKLLMGNEAFAHAALEAGVNVVAGYPGTPSSEVIETVARLHKAGKAEGVYVEWSCNEKAALEVAAAASMSGARALFTCKQVGLNVASDALMSLNYVGVRGGLVIFVADDPGPISSQTEQDTRRFASFAKIPVLDPATPEQGFQMMKEAFELSETYKTPVIVRPTTRIDHASTFFEVEPHTVARPLPEGEFQRDPSEWVIFPKRSYRAHGEINQRLNSIAYDFTYDTNLNRFNNGFDKVSGMPARPLPDLSTELGGSTNRIDEMYEADYAGERPKLGIVCGGVSRQYALEAIELIEREAEAAGALVPSYRFLQIGTPYPFPGRIARRFLKDLSDVLVLEELDSVIEEELLKVSGVSFLSPNIHGKLTKEAGDRGENSTEDVAYQIAAFFDRYSKSDLKTGHNYGVQSIPLEQLVEGVLGSKALLSYGGDLPVRAPVLCAGCPHRGSFYAMKRAIKRLKIAREDAVFCGDIGCYTLGNAMPLDACDTCLCMGAGITMAQGFSATNPHKKSIAFIGDSTFFASGMTGIANAVYNQHDITICVLDNSTTAMTGSQPHPGTGVTLMGGQSKPIDIEGVLKALGVQSISKVDPLDEAAAESACIESLLEEAPTAIIFKSPCVWLRPFSAPAKVHINACTGCKKCITEIGCPAIGFNRNAQGAKSKDRGQAEIDESQCNGCGLCLQVCPFKAIEILTPEEKALFESARRATSSTSGASVPGSINFGGYSAGGADEAGSASVNPDDAGASATDTTVDDAISFIGVDRDDIEDIQEPLVRTAEVMLEIDVAPKLEQVKLDDLDDNYDGLVGNLIDSLSNERFEEYSVAAAAYGSAKNALAHQDEYDDDFVAEHDVMPEGDSMTSVDAEELSLSQKKFYYMKNTSYRRKAMVNGSIGFGGGVSVAIDATPDVQPEESSAREDALNQQDEDAIDVFAALNSSVYIEVEDEQDDEQAGGQADDRVGGQNGGQNDRQGKVYDGDRQHATARQNDSSATKHTESNPRAQKMKAGQSSVSDHDQDSCSGEEAERLRAEEEAARKAQRETEKAKRYADDLAEREKMRAKYAQYAHYAPTQYATKDTASKDASKSSSRNSSDDLYGNLFGSSSTQKSDKPSVKQSRWGGRG